MEGFDCSGFIQWCLQSVGMDPKGDQSAQALYEHFFELGFVNALPKAGALAFYGSPEISHIALCINDMQVIEAGGGDSTTVNLEAAIKKQASVRIRPFDARKDLVSIIQPAYPKWVQDSG